MLRINVFLSAILLIGGTAAAFGETPAESSIRRARERLTEQPKNVSAFCDLAMSLARRARETSDVAYYQQAEDVLTQADSANPGSFEIAKIRVWLQLGRHEFAAAAESAAALNKTAPDDLTVWGYLADANAELGNYKQAVDAAQWMLRLRAGNIPGLTRAAYLRELHGDLDGAIDLMQRAYDATAWQETEDRAWLLTQIAHLHLMANRIEQADQYASGALELFPGYHYALGTLAQVRRAQKRFDDAVELGRKHYAAAPHPENLFVLAEALQAAGRAEEAREAFAKFEVAALAESKLADNSNHELMRYYTDIVKQPAKAIEIAKAELARRHDIHTLDSYAWALYQAGFAAEAKREMELASVTGSKDPLLLQHRALIQ